MGRHIRRLPRMGQLVCGSHAVPRAKIHVLLNPGMPSPTFRQDATTPHLTARHPQALFESTESFFAMPSGFFLWKAVNNQQAKIKYEIRLRSMFCGYLCRRGFAG